MSCFPSLCRDARGNVASIFGLLLPVIVVTTGMAVDTANVEASKWSMQRSVDAAALGAAKEYGRTQDPVQLERWASSLFFSNEGRDPDDNTVFTFQGVTRMDGNNVLSVKATRDEPTFFGSAVKLVTNGRVNLESWHLEVTSEVVVSNRSIELALVLDNSGSMARAPDGGTTPKINTLRDATQKLVQQMLAPQPLANAKDPVRISVVPFAGSVNIGDRFATADWMDKIGISPSHHDDIDWSALSPPGKKGSDGVWRQTNSSTPLTKFTLFNELKRKYADWAWGGCVQSRPGGLAITDTAPDIRNPPSLFVPLLSPAEYNWTGSLSSVKNDYLPESRSDRGKDTDNLKIQREASRYFSPPYTRHGDTIGPNSLCTTAAVTPLTATQSTVLDAVRSMQPKGGTNIAEGLAWGWRTLTSGQPFPEGRPTGTKENLKVIVLMTDGENTYNAAYTSGEQIELSNANRSQFGTYGYGQFLDVDAKPEKVRTGRMFEATKTTTARAAISNITAAMNETMSLACENIRKDGTNDDGGDGIVIFSIAFDLKDGSPIKERLRNCASNGIDGKGAKLYYDAKNSNDLLRAFSTITDEISALRIAR